ncbi:carboxypeptidase-like regulatory domain-containing protein [Anabaena sp. UHCC 0399]|uniref:carboxypeptidase-like regulatory domain-containing protein n=1 Tax=Anabaena sp. UHCC 0399 TaxID=3110238 RepID=UPI002B1EDD64|nr:carboxypeptidase-like regulatory domain-containing protein [Anabaena sp. UHCC 0399]MEA5567782.1 carboxypeptidase-like regulatory domain-containing protein [Anabaena sp. UHCC 0399]
MSKWIKLNSLRHQVAIAGQVCDRKTGQAIYGAIVEITQMPEPFKAKLALKALQYGSDWETFPERPDRTRTAVDGYFYFVNLPDGNYTLTGKLPGTNTRYDSAQTTVIVPSVDSDGKPKFAANIDLPPSGIKGQIKDPEGHSVRRAKVQIQGSGEYTFSNDEGKYLLSGLEAPKDKNKKRTVNVSVFAPGYQRGGGKVEFGLGEVTQKDFPLNKTDPKPTS